METSENMNIKLQNSGADGTSNTKGSARNLAEYLEHEDKEREEQGKIVFPFTTSDGIPVSKEEVIEKIDRNKAHLGKNVDKFLHMVISPSHKEIMAMGQDEREIYDKGIQYARLVADAYAQNFNREDVKDADDLLIFWKPHFTRGDDDTLQFHLHAIVSRKSKDGKKFLHALTPHRNTEKGAVQGGFDRTNFFRRCEKLFDKLIGYERKLAETFDYQNAMAHGTAEEKAEMAMRQAQEEEQEIREKLTAAFDKRRKHKKERNEVEELASLLEKKDFSFPAQKASVEDAMKLAEIGNDLMASMNQSADKTSLELNLACLGLSLKPVIGENGGVADFVVTYKGRQLKASTLVGNRLSTLLSRWEQFTGQASALTVRQRKEQQEAERKLRLAMEQEREQNRSRGMRLRR